MNVAYGRDDKGAPAVLISRRENGAFVASVPLWQDDCRFSHAPNEKFMMLAHEYPEPVLHVLQTYFLDRVQQSLMFVFHEPIP